MGAVAFKDIITFTRASGGGRFNASGQYEWLPANQPRIDYDLVTGECRGLLIEEQRTRINTVSVGASLLTPTRATYVEDGTKFLDGTTPFRKLVESADTGSHIGVPVSVSLVANTTYTASYIVKPAGRTRFSIEASGAVNWQTTGPTVIYDTLALTAVGSNGATGTIAAIGDGCFWVTWTATYGPANGSSSIYVVIRDGAGSNSYAGDGVSGLYISAYQVEAGSFATSLIAGEGSQVTRAAEDPLLSALSPWFSAAEGTFVIEHDAPSGRPLLSSGANLIAASQDVGRLVVAYDAAGSYVSHNGGAYVGGPALTFDSSLRLMRSASAWANAHCKSVRYYPRKLSQSEIA